MPAKIVRIQFEISEDRLESLDMLMKEVGIRTRTELFNNAMTLLRWAVKQRKEGRTIESMDRKSHGFIELEMPIFQNVDEGANIRDNSSASHRPGRKMQLD